MKQIIPLLEARALQVEFSVAEAWKPRRALRALRSVDVQILPGETLAVVGESGSGKSTLARALLRLIPLTSGDIRWRGENFLALRGAHLRRRRRDIQAVFQDPLTSLDPHMRVAQILAEPLQIHEPQLRAAERAVLISQALDSVGLGQDSLGRFSAQFSGGQCQRIAIARAMILRPALLVCDEPVSSLDVSVQGQIINLFADIQARDATSLLFISHNLALVRHLAHRAMVMYLGRVIEEAGTQSLFANPRHPYTRALIGAVAHWGDAERPAQPLIGDPPSALFPPSGCAYRTRCAFAIERCAAEIPELEETGNGHRVACHRWRELSDSPRKLSGNAPS